MAKNDLLIRLGLKNLKPTINGMKRVAGAVSTVGGTIKRFALNWKTLLGVGGVFTIALRESMKFGKGLNEIQTIGKQTDTELKRLSHSLRDVADDFGLDFADTAKAQYDIISAGIKGASQQAEVLKVSAELALAGVSDISTTADVLTSALNAYGDSLTDVTRVSDVLFKTVELGKTTIPELGSALGQVMPFASGAGVSIEMLGASLATITAGGISTSEAVISLKNTFIQLQSPTPRAKKAMEEFGVEIVKSDDGMIDFVSTMGSFQKIVENNPEAMRQLIPNITAQLAVKTLAGNMGKFKENVEGFNNISGTTSSAVEKMNEKFETQASMLKTKLQNAMVSLGDAIKKELLPHLKKINTRLEEIGDIGWEFIGQAIAQNLSAVLSIAMQIAGKGASIIGLTISNEISEGIRAGFPKISGTLDILSRAFAQITGGISGQMRVASEQLLRDNGINLTTLRILALKEEMKLLGAEGYTFVITKATDLKEEWEKANPVVDKLVAGTKTLTDATAKQGDEDENTAKVQQQSYADSLAGVRSYVQSRIAQAIADLIANSFKTLNPILAFAGASAGAIALKGLFDKFIPSFATGGEFITNGSQMIMVGDNPSGRERVTVDPLGAGQSSSSRNITVNISAPLVDETVRDSILPAIKRAVRMELA